MKTGSYVEQEIALCGVQVIGGVRTFVETGSENGYAIPLLEIRRIAGIKDKNPEFVIRVISSAFRVTANEIGFEIQSPCIDPEIPLTQQPRIDDIMTEEGFTRGVLTKDLGFLWSALATDMNPRGMYHAYLQSLIIERSYGLDVIDKPEYNTEEPLEGYGLDTVEYRSLVRECVIAGYPNASPFAIDRGTDVWFERFRECLAVQYSFYYEEETPEEMAQTLLTNVAHGIATRVKLDLPAYALV